MLYILTSISASSPNRRVGPSYGQRKTLSWVGIEPNTSRIDDCCSTNALLSMGALHGYRRSSVTANVSIFLSC